jgi:hypothetical protein
MNSAKSMKLIHLSNNKKENFEIIHQRINFQKSIFNPSREINFALSNSPHSPISILLLELQNETNQQLLDFHSSLIDCLTMNSSTFDVINHLFQGINIIGEEIDFLIVSLILSCFPVLCLNDFHCGQFVLSQIVENNFLIKKLFDEDPSDFYLKYIHSILSIFSATASSTNENQSIQIIEILTQNLKKNPIHDHIILSIFSVLSKNFQLFLKR